MPYKVLIADDERVIREGMATLIDWNLFGFSVCGLAANGIEALEMVAEAKPDLMLVDIQMPHLSGLLLIERAKAIAPDLEFIIITGHDEFDFARQAINLGVRDYLLKPVKEHRLLESVERIRKEMDRQRQSRVQYDFAMSQLQKNMTVLRDQFLQQLISGQLVQEEIDELLAFHDLHREFDHFCLLRQSRQSRLASHGEWDRQLLRFAIQNIFEEKLAECGPFVCTADTQYNLFALVKIDSPKAWQHLSRSVAEAMRQTLDLDIRLDQAGFGQDWTAIADCYERWTHEQARPANPLTERAITFIANHYSDPELTFRRLCEALFVSSSYLSKIFKQDTHETFVDYLAKFRIQKSLQLLANPEIRMYEIASQVGYKSQQYFSAAFKKILGVSPSEYRAREFEPGPERPAAPKKTEP